MPVYSDSHVHLTFDKFDADRDAVIARAREAGVVHMITISSYLGDAERCAELAAQHPSIHFTAGVHAHEANRWGDTATRSLRGLSRRPKLVAIGEIGLDYHYDHSPPDVQRVVFRKQIALARDLGLPIVIHTREAWNDTFTILEEEGATAIGGVFHCFTGGVDEARRCLDLGFYLSFAGPITFKSPGQIPEAATCVPLDRLLTETDAPFLAPHPHRGKRNEPAYVVLVAERIAALRGVTAEEIGEATTRNLETVFRLTERVDGA